MISTSYFGLLRVGEITSGDHPVLATDVHIAANKRKIMFVLHTSKTHWKNMKPQMIKITSSKATNKKKGFWTRDNLLKTKFVRMNY